MVTNVASHDLRLENCHPAVRATLFGAHEGTRTALVFLPAMGVRTRAYEHVCKALAAQGCAVALASLRNAGEVEPSRVLDFGYKELLEELDAVVRAMRRELPTASILVGGHSLGGQLSALYAARHAHELSGLYLLAACSVYYRGWGFPKNLGVLALSQGYRIAAELLGYFPGHRFGFAGREARGVMRDWSRQGRTGRYELVGDAFDYESALGRCQLPCFALSLEHDALAPQSAVNRLCAKLRLANLTRRHIALPQHTKRSPHFAWMKRPDLVLDPLVTWAGSLHQREAAPRS